jgi:hypothetical protein
MSQSNGFESIVPSASPIASMGLDPDEVLASGDPAAYIAAKRAGVPYTPPNARPAPVAKPPVSALAAAAPGTNVPAATGTSAAQPEHQQGVSRDATPYFLQNPNSQSDSLSNFGSNLAQSQVPATNAPNPPGEAEPTPAVPGTITPSGTPDDPNQKTLQDASGMGMDFAKNLAAQPTLEQKLQPIEDQRKAIAQPIDPMKYKPTAGQRIVRGLVGAGLGVAEHGIFGGLRGALDPESVGGTAYSAPTRQFSLAAQRQAGQLASIDQQEKLAQDTYKDDTGRAKDVITSINDIGKNAAAGQNSQARMDTAAARTETAKVAGQLADIKQQVADFQGQGKVPTSYEATVAAAALEKDPERKASLNGAAKTMAATELKKFQYKAKADGAEANNTFRQSLIDSATEKVKALQDKYTYNPRRNQYENPNNPNDVLNPNEYTDKKNEISSDLDKQLGQKKMKPLGVRFNSADAGAGKPTGRAARNAPAAAPAPAAPKKPAPPTPTAPAPDGATDMALGSDGQYHYRDSARRDLGVVK